MKATKFLAISAAHDGVASNLLYALDIDGRVWLYRPPGTYGDGSYATPHWVRLPDARADRELGESK